MEKGLVVGLVIVWIPVRDSDRWREGFISY